MKIEHKGVHITEVPGVVYIDTDGDVTHIRFEGVNNLVVFKNQNLRELHEAIGEVLNRSGGSVSPEIAIEPRTWADGDPEPTDVTAVIDCDGDRWEKNSFGEWRHGGRTYFWDKLVRAYGRVTEAK